MHRHFYLKGETHGNRQSLGRRRGDDTRPYARTIKMLFAPDKGGVKELSFSFALIDPFSQTDEHAHDRPELIYIVSGRGLAICDGQASDVPAGEKHQMKNTGAETLKFATVFVPGYTTEFNTNRCLEAARAQGG
jgi:mannose-6-phosphate isomerase-like protein (cupin superfamily)